MNRLLPLLMLAASAASAGALSELVSLSGAAELPAVPAVKGAAASRAARASQPQSDVIYTSRTVWNAAFPLARQAVEASAAGLMPKDYANYRCEYTRGAASARCDYAYDVWPEICWYGYDHVVVDIELASGRRTEVKREWRAGD
jgi:hypothetical protein